MLIWRSVLTAFAMFSRLPMPRVEWRADNLRYALCALPLVGLVIGLAVWGWLWLCALLSCGAVLRAAGATLLPVIITGGLHLDGWCDVTDALASQATAEKKRAILKDPHVGAFAVIGTTCYILAYFALATELTIDRRGLLLCWLPVLSRVTTGAASLLFPAHDHPGLLHDFRTAGGCGARWALLVWAVVVAAALLYMDLPAGALLIFAAAGAALYSRWLALRNFGGFSGDCAGFLLQLVELSGLLLLVIVQKVVLLCF